MYEPCALKHCKNRGQTQQHERRETLHRKRYGTLMNEEMIFKYEMTTKETPTQGRS